MKEIFKKYDDDSTPSFNFNGINCYARVVNITDGDTIKVVINFCNNFYKIIVRLNNIDTCETKSKVETNKDLGMKAKMRLFNLITNKEQTSDKKEIKKTLTNDVYLIWIKCYDFDKYGRVLGDIYLHKDGNKSMSDILIEEKLAYVYTGKTKLLEEDQVKLLSI